MNEIPPQEQANYKTFRECLSEQIISALADNPDKKRKRVKRTKSIGDGGGQENVEHQDESVGSDVEELAEFVEYLSTEIFSSLPEALRNLSYSSVQSSPSLTETYATPLDRTTLESITDNIPPPISDSLASYALLTNPSTLTSFLAPILNAYIASLTTPPPPWSSTRTEACELCLRDWIPLTYHHLFPKAVHAKALKRGWAEEWEINKVAWLCRACHNMVHRVAGHEELAREWHSVEKLASREDVKAFVEWMGRVRWKSR